MQLLCLYLIRYSKRSDMGVHSLQAFHGKGRYIFDLFRAIPTGITQFELVAELILCFRELCIILYATNIAAHSNVVWSFSLCLTKFLTNEHSLR